MIGEMATHGSSVLVDAGHDIIKAKKIFLKKIAGVANPADVATKPKSIDEMEKLMKIGGCSAVRRR